MFFVLLKVITVYVSVPMHVGQNHSLSLSYLGTHGSWYQISHCSHCTISIPFSVSLQAGHIYTVTVLKIEFICCSLSFLETE